MEDTDLLQGDKPVTPPLPLSGSQALFLLHLVSNSRLSRCALNQVQQPPNLPKMLPYLVNWALSYEVLSSTKDPCSFRWRGSRTHVLDKWWTPSYYVHYNHWALFLCKTRKPCFIRWPPPKSTQWSGKHLQQLLTGFPAKSLGAMQEFK